MQCKPGTWNHRTVDAGSGFKMGILADKCLSVPVPWGAPFIALLAVQHLALLGHHYHLRVPHCQVVTAGTVSWMVLVQKLHISSFFVFITETFWTIRYEYIIDLHYDNELNSLAQNIYNKNRICCHCVSFFIHYKLLVGSDACFFRNAIVWDSSGM